MKPIVGETDGFMGNPPHRFKRRGVLPLPWDQMPMDMRQLVAQQFIVHLYGLPFSGEQAGY